MLHFFEVSAFSRHSQSFSPPGFIRHLLLLTFLSGVSPWESATPLFSFGYFLFLSLEFSYLFSSVPREVGKSARRELRCAAEFAGGMLRSAGPPKSGIRGASIFFCFRFVGAALHADFFQEHFLCSCAIF